MAAPPSVDRGSSSWLDREVDRVWLMIELAKDPRAGELASRLAAATAAVYAARVNAPVGRLMERLGLGALELDLLALAIAPHIDPSLSDALASIHRGHARRGVELALCAELLGLDRAGRLDLFEAVDAERPLVALRLLTVDPDDGRAAGTRAVKAALDVVPLLAGRCELSPSVRRSARLERPVQGELPGAPDAAWAHALSEVTTLAARAGDAEPPWLALWGPRGAGKTTLARHLAAASGRALVVFDPTRVTDGSGDEQLRRVQRDALVHDAVLMVCAVRGDLLVDGARELGRRLATFPAMIVLGIEADAAPRLALPRAAREVAVPVPDEIGRRSVWEAALPEEARGPDVELAALARGWRMTPGEIRAVVDEARAVAAAPVAHADLRDGIARRLRTELGDLAREVRASTQWADVVLPDDQRERLFELCDRHKLAQTVYGEWKLGERIGYGRGLIALFSGPPGTGKTMLAGAVAADLDLALYKVDLSAVVSKWVGETEKQLARAFDLAERAHAVLLFDEADALLGTRTKVESANDRYGNLAVNYLLARLEEYGGVAILTTNHEAALDSALQRRLTLHLRLELPGEPERAALWRSFLPMSIPGAAAVDVAALARRWELAGGHIKNAATRAAFLAARQDRPLDTALCHHAARLECDDMGRL